MKPIKTKSFLVQIGLIVFAVMLGVLGFVLSAKSIPFFPSVQATLVNEETTIRVAQGIMPLSHAFLFLSFLLIWLVFEFYGFKPAFYTSLNLAGAILGCYGLFILLKRFLLDPQRSVLDDALAQVLPLNPRLVLSLVAGVLVGFSLALMLGALIKKLTRNYFMFIRFPIAAAVGLGTLAGISIYVMNLNILSPASMLLDAVAPASHFLALIIASVIPLYVLRLFLGIFRGRVCDDENEDLSDKSLFKGADQVGQPAPPPAPARKSLPPTPQEEPEENTVSKKIVFDNPSG